MKDSTKEIIFKIELSEDDFNICSSIPFEKDTLDRRDKTLLLIALHQLKENILNDSFSKLTGVEQ
jgi:hypothetical protein